MLDGTVCILTSKKNGRIGDSGDLQGQGNSKSQNQNSEKVKTQKLLAKL